MTIRKARWLLAILLPGVILACTLPALLSGAQPAIVASTPAPTTLVLVTPDPNAAPTPTPFQPVESLPIVLTGTLTGTQQIGPVWGDYPGPTVNPGIAIPPPVGLLPQPAGQFNVLILGSDQRPNDGGFRTDTILLLTINPLDGSASLTSFPRDLYVYIPGWTMQRINTAQAHGGFPTTQLTFEYNFGVRPDRFIMINFWGFSQVVDSLGGIYVDVAVPHSDHRDRYGRYSVPAGTVYMDGATALWYVRSRYSTNDFDRTRRQQEVLLALFFRLLSLDAVQRAPELFDLYRQNVLMDLTLDDAQPFLPLATQVGETNNIRRYAIGSQNVTLWRTPGGASVLLPNREDVIEIMRQALNSPTP